MGLLGFLRRATAGLELTGARDGTDSGRSTETLTLRSVNGYSAVGLARRCEMSERDARGVRGSLAPQGAPGGEQQESHMRG
jgi:hypothetical protein